MDIAPISASFGASSAAPRLEATAGGGFGDALAAARATAAGPEVMGSAVQPLLHALSSIDGEATRLHAASAALQASGAEMTPGEAVMLTMQCSEFMFHAQLTASAANQSSNGLQELFRQQG